MGRATGKPEQAVRAVSPRRGGRMTEREIILRRVRAMGFKHAYEVGGCVRDEVLGVEPKDIDISVAGHSKEELLEIAGREGHVEELLVAGRLCGVRLYAPWAGKGGIEIALARTEVSTGGGRHAFDVTTNPDVTILEDLARRDFTCNAMARDVVTGELIDPYNGAEDLRNGVLRTVSAKSFPEDPLRVLRGLARCAKDGLRPDPATFEQMRYWAEDPKRFMRAHAHALIADYVAGLEATMTADEIRRLAQLANTSWSRPGLGDRAGLLRLIELGLYQPGTGLDTEELEDWAQTAIDDPGKPRVVFESATGYRWYGEVPISPERIYAELTKTLSGRQAADALRIARDAGALAHIVPELADAVGFDQMSKFHSMTVDDHTFMVLQRACELDAPPEVRWAALMHDSGKPTTAWGWLTDHAAKDGRRAVSAEEFLAAPAEQRDPEDPHLHFFARPATRAAADDKRILAPGGLAHEQAGEENVQTLMNRLAADGETTRAARMLVAEHMYHDDDDFLNQTPSVQERRARRFLRRIGPDQSENLMLLRRCDRSGKHGTLEPGWDAEIAAFEACVRHQRDSKAPLTTKDLAVDGHALMRAGFQGPAIGLVQERLLTAVIDDPELNSPEQLLPMAEAARAEVTMIVSERARARTAGKKRKAKAT